MEHDSSYFESVGIHFWNVAGRNRDRLLGDTFLPGAIGTACTAL